MDAPLAPHTPLLVWLTPSLIAVLLYGLGQGFVKKWIGEVAPARFCLYFIVARALFFIPYWALSDHPSLLAPDGHKFLALGVFAYLLDGTGWILYFESIIAGPITIVGTLSAAYPALVVVFARIFQYGAVVVVITGCIGLSYSPANGDARIIGRRWIPLSFGALVCWASAQTIVKYTYGLPEASTENMALASLMGGALTLGTFGLIKGRAGVHSMHAWTRALVPMLMMAGGDLGVLIASRFGPISIVTPLTGAYPVVTLVFAAIVLKERISRLQWGCLAAIIGGICLLPSS
jgi:drug/metabolite transporter (DMT)-like permease